MTEATTELTTIEPTPVIDFAAYQTMKKRQILQPEIPPNLQSPRDDYWMICQKLARAVFMLREERSGDPSILLLAKTIERCAVSARIACEKLDDWERYVRKDARKVAKRKYKKKKH